MDTKKLVLLNLPYIFVGYFCDKVAWLWRVSEGTNASDKMMAVMNRFDKLFANPLPSFHPRDLLIGVAGGIALRLVVYYKAKNAMKFRQGVEYGSARWGNAKDIEPYMDSVFENNVLLTQTERLMMSGRPKEPKYARNKNILVIGGSGSGTAQRTITFEKMFRDGICQVSHRYYTKMVEFFDINYSLLEVDEQADILAQYSKSRLNNIEKDVIRNLNNILVKIFMQDTQSFLSVQSPRKGSYKEALKLKSDFIITLCDLIAGGKDGLQNDEKGIVDECIRHIYDKYFENPVPENMPLLEDLYDALLAHKNPKAERIANSLVLYVHGSQNYFNHHTNVDSGNRIMCFDIRDLGNQLKELGMLIVQDAVRNRVSQNRERKIATRYYCDEFHLLLKEKQTAIYSVEIWKRFRKWGGIPTGLTQNVGVRPDRALCKVA